MESAVKVMKFDEIRGQLTENESLTKSKCASCPAYTSHAFYIVQKEKDDWEACMFVDYKEGDGISSKSDAIRQNKWANDRFRILDKIKVRILSSIH
jgi:hypothetical protein